MQTCLSFDNIFRETTFHLGDKLESGEKLWSQRGSSPLYLMGNYAPDSKPLPLGGWRNIGMRFSKVLVKRRIAYCYIYLFKLFTWQFDCNIPSICKIIHPKRKKDKWRQLCRRIQVILPNIFEMKKT